ncbi:MAG: hypothetical protein ACREUU_11545, partial [Gammaproteobacteria bacterium]
RYARFASPTALALDDQGNLYIADTGNHRIRKIVGVEACEVVRGPLVVYLGGVTNAAGSGGGPVAPGEIVSIYGERLGPENPVHAALNGDGRLSTSLGGTRVLFNGIPAPLTYVQARQINAIVPYGVRPGTNARFEVETGGVRSEPRFLPVREAAPGVFVILNEDGTPNSASNPARKGSIVIFYGTGEGQTIPPGENGKLAVEPFPRPRLPVTLRIGQQPAEVLYAGAAPGLAGVFQINARISGDAASGAAPFELRFGRYLVPLVQRISVE